MEYWATLAENDPTSFQAAVENILGTIPTYKELYGVDNPEALSTLERGRIFKEMHTSINGRPPISELNRDNALFMYHQINGLDDLIFVVMFGAKPYEALDDTGLARPATLAEIFIAKKAEYLACRNADPAAADGPQQQMWQGKKVSFTPELGMYLRQSISESTFLLEGKPIPSSWLRWSRDEATGMYQHLSLGPTDAQSGYLDDAKVLLGGTVADIDGAYAIAQLLDRNRP